MERSNDAPARGGREAVLAGVVYGAAVFAAVFEAISLHGTLAGSRPTGAYLGFAVCLVIAVAASTAMPSPQARNSLLARAAVLLSAVALVSTLVIPGRIAEAQGTAPSGVPVAQAGLFLLFQLGWALTRWLTVDRRIGGEARHIPAAVGSVLLIVGGFLVGRGDDTVAGVATDAEATAVFDQFSDMEDLAFATESEIAGEPGTIVFAHYHPGGQPLLGLSFSTKEWFGRNRISSDLTGVFERDAETEGTHRLLAPDGQVIAGVEVQAGDYVSALRVQFAPWDGTFVSPYDRAWSDWYGGYERGGRTTGIDGATRPIVGLRGSGGMVLTSLSLLTPN